MRSPLTTGRGETVESSTEKYSPLNVTFSSVHSRRTSRMNSLVRA